MCDFVSWIEFEGKNYWLNNECLLTKDGKALRAKLGSKFHEDIKGHGAIAEYWHLGQAGHKECTNFSSPKNFPAEIVKDIKAGRLSMIGFDLYLLNSKGRAEYEKVTGPAEAEYQKVKGQALAEYEKVTGPAEAEYQKVKGPAEAECQKVTGPAEAEYQKVKGPAEAECQKVTGPAEAEYQKARLSSFWKIFKNKTNRAKDWK